LPASTAPAAVASDPSAPAASSTATPVNPVAAASASDPSWDSAQRVGFSYPLGLLPLLAERSSLPSLCQGTTWHYFQCDVYATDALIVDVNTGTIFPWSAPRPNYGVLVHHPLRTSAVHMDRKLFLANMSNKGFDTHFFGI
jgi:hypothetical protein